MVGKEQSVIINAKDEGEPSAKKGGNKKAALTEGGDKGCVHSDQLLTGEDRSLWGDWKDPSKERVL